MRKVCRKRVFIPTLAVLLLVLLSISTLLIYRGRTLSQARELYRTGHYQECYEFLQKHPVPGDQDDELAADCCLIAHFFSYDPGLILSALQEAGIQPFQEWCPYSLYETGKIYASLYERHPEDAELYLKCALCMCNYFNIDRELYEERKTIIQNMQAEVLEKDLENPYYAMAAYFLPHQYSLEINTDLAAPYDALLLSQEQTELILAQRFYLYRSYSQKNFSRDDPVADRKNREILEECCERYPENIYFAAVEKGWRRTYPGYEAGYANTDVTDDQELAYSF